MLLDAGLSVNINTPLCSVNADYVETLKFLKFLGVTYVTCSGLIPAGNAVTENSKAVRLKEKRSCRPYRKRRLIAPSREWNSALLPGMDQRRRS